MSSSSNKILGQISYMTLDVIISEDACPENEENIKE